MNSNKIFWGLLNGDNVASQALTITTIDAQTGYAATTHNLTLVQAGSLLVLSTCNESNGADSVVSSVPSLTWTKRPDAQGTCGNAEIWTAVFTVGGSITVTSNWGATYQSSVCYVIRGQEITLQGAQATAIDQSLPSVNINSTKDNSLFICVSSDWNAGNGTITYRGTALQTLYQRDAAAASFYHYYYVNGVVGSHTVGMLSPSAALGAGTAVLEIRGSGAPPGPDITDPTAPVLSVGTITQNSVSLTWTASTDNVGVMGYDVYRNSILYATTTGLAQLVTGLTASTTYNFFVRAKDAAGNTTDSNTVSPTTLSGTDTTSPTAPTISSTGTTSSTIGISWTGATDNVGVTGYDLYLNSVFQQTVTGGTFTFSGLAASTNYTIKVKARDAAGNTSVDSNTLSVTTSASGPGGNVTFALTEIPYADPDIITYGRGAEQWHFPNGACSVEDRISNPSVALNPQGTENSKNAYHRIEWFELEGDTQGDYQFTPGSDFGDRLASAINNDQMFSFGIMPFNNDSTAGHSVPGGGKASYPNYLHIAMQALPAGQRDTLLGSDWMPNWNSTIYLQRLRALHTALNSYLLTATHTFISGPRNGQTVNVRDSIYCIDIRGFGQYGEWHSNSMFNFGSYSGSTYTPGAAANIEPSLTRMKELIDAHTEIFQNWPLVMMVAGFNGQGGAPGIKIFQQHDELGYYALTATNTWGKVGYRRDQVLSTEGYLNQLLRDNSSTFNGSPAFNTLFFALGDSAPGTGEPLPGAYHNFDLSGADANMVLYKHTSFGNGNWPGCSISPTANTSSKSNQVRNAWKRCGFRLKITTGEAPQVITRNTPFNIKLNWQNVGITPTYENWDIIFELQSGSTPVWSGTSSKVLKLFRPSQGVVQTTDIFTVTNSTATGTYKLVFRVKDPTGYKSLNLKLALQGQNADGSYTIFNTVTVN